MPAAAVFVPVMAGLYTLHLYAFGFLGAVLGSRALGLAWAARGRGIRALAPVAAVAAAGALPLAHLAWLAATASGLEPGNTDYGDPGGKILALVSVVAVGVTVSALGGIAAAFALAPVAGVSTAAWTTGAAVSAASSTTVNVMVATVVWGLAGAVLAMVTRSASAAITVGIGYLLAFNTPTEVFGFTLIPKLTGGAAMLGGAIAMNAGAYGQEIGNMVERIVGRRLRSEAIKNGRIPKHLKG